jgi:hypothetical protein
MLSPGEAVIPRSLMNNDFVKGFVESILGGGFNPSQFAFGGVSQPGSFAVERRTRVAMGPVSPIEQMTSQGVRIDNIVINAKTNLDADAIRREVIPAMERHLKRKSQDGEFVLSSKGVRS